MAKRNIRAFGWVQDASSYDNLVKFVSIFDRNSEYFPELIVRINELVLDVQEKNKFIKKLSSDRIVLTYNEIVGKTIAKTRKDDPCNSIGQAALPGQRKKYQGDWPVDNFVRWAHVLQFISYDDTNDTFQITELGKKFLKSYGDKKIYKYQLVKIPYVRYIMSLIKDESLNKFEVGNKLGFIGERGFTSVNTDLFRIRYDISTIEERKKLKSDYEGSSDKYVRQVFSWLKTAELVDKTNKQYGENLKLSVYKLNDDGRKILEETKEEKIFVPYEMLSMEIKNKEFHKVRRALIIELINNKVNTIDKIIAKVEEYFDMYITKYMIYDDIKGLCNIGIKIEKEKDKYKLCTKYNGLKIPDKKNIILELDDEIMQIKEYCRRRLKYVNHKYLSIIDASYNSRSGREFEFITSELLSEVYETFLLAGPSRPDIVIKREDIFASIIDTKSYKDKFSLPQSERDKMVRYITEYKEKNTGEWWKNISNITEENISYMFVSSGYKGKIIEKLNDITKRTNINGSAYTAKTLLFDIEFILETKKYNEFEDKVKSNKVI